ncbi:hypothetical protein M3223_13455 [Paenibacillus pasadenensis]|uniref:hypothetical protein n=1 Tax=Paenibacillus pasadenensis TaxID=217090 RepID=UPI00203ADAEF|nr:hypothetical protein [Paenibacillus pasadenensis]MCM3748357.1 hypothetical protein [Paenibacillus pasadenensis]
MRKIPISLLFKMFAGGKFYSCQICLIFSILFLRLGLIYDRYLVFLFIALIVIGILISLWIRTFNQLIMLKNGVLMTARFVRREPTHFVFGNKQILKTTYEFNGVNNERGFVNLFDIETENEEELVDVLVSKYDNKKAVVVEGITGSPRLDQLGNISPVNIIGNVLIYIVCIPFYF